MKQVAAKLLLGQLAFAKADASSHIPMSRAAKFDAATLTTRDGDLMQVLRLCGVPSDTADPEAITAWKHQRHSALRSIAHPQLGVWFHAVRRELNAYPEGGEADGYALDLDRRWRSRWDSKRFYTNEFYISVIRRMPKLTAGSAGAVIDRLFKGGKAEAQAQAVQQAKAHVHLRQVVQQLEKLLGLYGAELLAADPDTGQHDALSFLGYLINGEYAPVSLPQRDLSRALAWNEIEFGRNEMRVRDRVGRSKYSALLSVDEYPPATFPGMLDSLLHLPAELTFTQSFTYQSPAESRKQLKRQGARYEQVDDDAKSLGDELHLARDQVARSALVFGHHQLTVQVTCRDRELLTDHVGDVIAKLNGCGVVTFRESRGLEPAFWASLPGNRRYTARAFGLTPPVIQGLNLE